MSLQPTLLLTRSDVESLLGLPECMEAVEEAFRLHGQGRTLPPGILGVHVEDGGFHIKAGVLDQGRPLFAAKINANFPLNGERHGLPLIQGVIVLMDGESGRPLAVTDSTQITMLRTGAATGVAAKHLARRDATTVTICGCGIQGRISLRALREVRPLTRVFAYDIDEERAGRFAGEMSGESGIPVEATSDLESAVRRSAICVTCTPSREPLIHRSWVMPGSFIAAVGADNEHKQELDPELMAAGKVIADVLEQSATIGDLHHAIERGLMTRADVHAELGEVIAGKKAGRSSDEEIIIFDSTGMALQDVAAVVLTYRRATEIGAGLSLHLGE
jgi:alanine dehydrogenase